MRLLHVDLPVAERHELIDNPGTPPVSTYSVAVHLTAGTTYTLSISGESSQVLWATPRNSPHTSVPPSAAAKSA